jgi:hypothetical protein
MVIAALLLSAGCTTKPVPDNQTATSEYTSSPVVTASVTGEWANIVPPSDMPITNTTPRTKTSGRWNSEMEVENIHDFLVYWNQQLNWGFSPEQIDAYSERMEQGVLKKYLTTPGSHWLHIPNDRIFYLEVGAALGFTEDQSEKFVRDIDAQDLKYWQAGGDQLDPTVLHTSVPYAG